MHSDSIAVAKIRDQVRILAMDGGNMSVDFVFMHGRHFHRPHYINHATPGRLIWLGIRTLFGFKLEYRRHHGPKTEIRKLKERTSRGLLGRIVARYWDVFP